VRALSFDMGGTTAKICLIHNLAPYKARTFEVDRQSRFMKGSGLPVRIPVIEMVEIGAGGGSIARVDALKRITVGPDSAGSQPGPACYGRGGAAPTVTDADVALGKVDPARFAGGKISLAPEKAGDAITAGIAALLGLDMPTAAFGIGEIVEENMANAARVHAVERGVAVTDHTLVAFGGAAPLHAARLAEKLGIKRIVIPADEGVGSAVGFLRAPAAYELVQSRYQRLDRFDAAAMSALLAGMSAQAREQAQAAAGDRPLFETRQAFMRYAGQGHEIAVALPNRPLEAGDVVMMREHFEEGYRKLFSRHIPGAVIEVLSWAVLVSTAQEPPPRLGDVAPAAAPAPIGMRAVFDGKAARAVEIPVYARDAMTAGASISGPALVVEAGTSTFISAGFDAALDAGLGLVLTAKE